MSDYEDSKLEHLLDKKAYETAITFVQWNNNRIDESNKETLTSAQLRRFYNEFKLLEKRAGINGDKFSEVLPLIRMIKSKAAYASNKKNQKIPNKFATFLKESVDSKNINDFKHFKNFMLYFEAIVGFYYGFGIKNN